VQRLYLKVAATKDQIIVHGSIFLQRSCAKIQTCVTVSGN